MKARQKIYRTQSLSEHVSPKQQRLSMPFAALCATLLDCVVSLGNSGICAKGGGQH
jgi:hypothetical protein